MHYVSNCFTNGNAPIATTASRARYTPKLTDIFPIDSFALLLSAKRVNPVTKRFMTLAAIHAIFCILLLLSGLWRSPRKIIAIIPANERRINHWETDVTVSIGFDPSIETRIRKNSVMLYHDKKVATIPSAAIPARTIFCIDNPSLPATSPTGPKFILPMLTLPPPPIPALKFLPQWVQKRALPTGTGVLQNGHVPPFSYEGGGTI